MGSHRVPGTVSGTSCYCCIIVLQAILWIHLLILSPPSLHFSHSGLMTFPGSCHTGSCLKVFATVASSGAELFFFFSMSPAVFDLHAYKILINCSLLGGLPWPPCHSLTSIWIYFVIAFTLPWHYTYVLFAPDLLSHLECQFPRWWDLAVFICEVGDGQGGLACCSLWDRRVRHDWATELNWYL